LQLGGKDRIHLAQRRRVHRPIFTVERGAISQELVAHGPHGKDVRATIHPALRLLRRHVAERAHDEARPGQSAAVHRAGEPSDAKVEDLYLTGTKNIDVPRFYVTVNDAALVGEVKPIGDLHYYG